MEEDEVIIQLKKFVPKLNDVMIELNKMKPAGYLIEDIVSYMLEKKKKELKEMI